MPTVFKRNVGKIFVEQEPGKRKLKATAKVVKENCSEQVDDANVDRPIRPDEKVRLQIELDSVERELEKERTGQDSRIKESDIQLII